MSHNVRLYLWAIGTSFGISFILTPIIRALALRYGWMDAPSSSIKTHKVTTPSLGGVAIFAGFAGTLIILRYLSRFPTGTLYDLRAILIGAAMVCLLGVIDDLKKPVGLHFKPKFGVQSLAALVLMAFGFRIRFITPDYLARALTLLWVVGITNALNIIDIMDGLCASQAMIAALGFLMISLPSEKLYVNFAAAALAGAAAGFIPWNLSSKRKIFMGDSGSMTLGFVLAALSLGTKYSERNNLGVFAPLFILFVPLYDTLFVMFLRLRAGQSPFLGSKDHFALRLEEMGYPRRRVVLMAAGAAGFLTFCAFLVTQLSIVWAALVYAIVLAEILILSRALAEVRMK
jgi:UDP-GlcNAc:undecaprenyl-phosphate/decaprenyl-phosphate GlcNAc-1-phosphate transferase